MNQEGFEKLEKSSATTLVDRFAALREQAEQVVAERVEALKATGDAIELSDEEIRMIRAYRRFVSRTKPGGVFSWRSRDATENKIVTPGDVSIILDPQEVSGI